MLTVDQRLWPWLAYQQGRIEPLALRAYFGLREIPARRCQLAPGTPAAYRARELQRLLGPAVRLPQVEAVIEALETSGLATWTERSVQLSPQPDALQGDDLAAYAAIRAYVHEELDRVPVPRRMLRYLAREGSPGLIATTLGVVLRCLRYYSQQKQCVSGGAISAAWLAACFGLPERTAYNGLATRAALDWLALVPTPRWHQHKYGPWRVVNLAWDLPPLPLAPARRAGAPRPRRPRQLVLFSLTAPAGAARAAATAEVKARAPQAQRVEGTGAARAAAAGAGPPTDTDLNLAATPEAPATTAGPAVERLGTSPPAHRAASAGPRLEGAQDHDCKNLAVCTDTRPSNNAAAQQTHPKPLPEIHKHQKPATRGPAGVDTVQEQGGKDTVLPSETWTALEAHDTTLPEATQTAWRPEAEATLLQQGYQRDFLVWPVVLQQIYRRLAAQAGPATPGGPADRSWAKTAPSPTADPLAPIPAPAAPPPPTSAAALGPPTLRDVTPEDLHDVGRVLTLGEQARARGWGTGSEADRLNVVAAAVHARRVGQAPGALFVALLHDRRWEVITQEDEDTARGWLRAYLYGPRLCEEPTAAISASEVPLSDDARFVTLAQRVLQQAGWRGEPFLAVKMHWPEWTLTRWEHAQAALAQWRLQQAQLQARHCLASLGERAGADEPWEQLEEGQAGDHREVWTQPPAKQGQRGHAPPQRGMGVCSAGLCLVQPNLQTAREA